MKKVEKIKVFIDEYNFDIFKDTLSSLKKWGKSEMCPFSDTDHPFCNDCTFCNAIWPKNGSECPCHSNYTKKYLIRTVSNIIKNGYVMVRPPKSHERK